MEFFLDKIYDLFLFQHAVKPTHFRLDTTPSLLDLHGYLPMNQIWYKILVIFQVRGAVIMFVSVSPGYVTHIAMT